jgi:hypothetical protein
VAVKQNWGAHHLFSKCVVLWLLVQICVCLITVYFGTYSTRENPCYQMVRMFSKQTTVACEKGCLRGQNGRKNLQFIDKKLLAIALHGKFSQILENMPKIRYLIPT